MARGFESKGSAEYAGSADDRRKRPRFDREEIEKTKKREDLELTRSRIEHELEATQSDLRRRSLRAALEHIEREIEKLK